MQIISQELREEAKNWDQRLEEICTKENQLQNRVTDLRDEEKQLVQLIDEISQLPSSHQS